LTNGTNDQIEEGMLARYVGDRLKGIHTFVHLRLGQPRGFSRDNPATRETRALYLSTLPEADLVTRTLDTATIYEFTIWKPSAKLGQLQLYRDLLPETPGFEDIDAAAVKMVLVTGQNDGNITRSANTLGITVEYYLPPDIAAKVAARRGKGEA